MDARDNSKVDRQRLAKSLARKPTVRCPDAGD
jgi:hypothetical protein